MKLGDVLDGKYRLVRQIRSGGMGSVYVADRIALGDTVAIKIILPEQNTETTRARFLREAQAAARIRHPNVVQIFDFGSSDAERPYIVMEYLDGPTLDDELQRHHRFASPRAITLFRSVCAAVEAGHRRGILHRDLKPGNVMLPRMDDGTEVVKVLDFGLARFTGETESMQLTSPGALLGTYAYMSPEQVLSERLGPPSDVFSLGTLLYEMVTGRLPFHAPSSYTLMDRIVSCKYTAPETIIPDV
ncbi:MAG: serine/threonine-protein kinase, partial [Blastocatellia bacterium]